MRGILKSSISLLLLFALQTVAQWEHGNSDKLFDFVTRPDLKAPKWNVTVYHPELVSPGYWFVGPYPELRGKEEETDSWVGPHIYDGEGELIWSGAEMFENGKDTMSFQIHNVRGEDLMTALDWSTGEGVIFDNHYEIRETIDIYGGKRPNAHEFHFVQDGKKALVIKTRYETASRDESKALGLETGECHVDWDGIEEYDTSTWETTWEWSSSGRVFLNESTYNAAPVEKRCDRSHLGWDFMHCNSIDKSVNGDYFLSCRHTNTIYKISHQDGSIIWRLGGEMSDFDQGDLVFGRQHNIRIREENDTHTIISFLDNAKGQDEAPPSHEFSRGLLLALDEMNLKSTVLKAIDHPDLGYAPKRGNYQVLPNDNIFMGWSTKSLHSEHTSDGTMVMQARMLAGWLGSYRNYKFAFVGLPLSSPDIHSAAYGQEDSNEARTVIHVSWNGASEVATWRFYKTIQNGKVKELLGTRARHGFETSMEVEGYASFIQVEGLDIKGEVLGTSAVFKTIPHVNLTSAAVEEESQWLAETEHLFEDDDSAAPGEVEEVNNSGEVGKPVISDNLVRPDNSAQPDSAGNEIDLVQAHADGGSVSHEHSADGADQEDSEHSGFLVSFLHSQVSAFVVGFFSCATIAWVVGLTWRREIVGRYNYDELENGIPEINIERFEDDDEDVTIVEDEGSEKLLRSKEKSIEPPDRYDV